MKQKTLNNDEKTVKLTKKQRAVEAVRLLIEIYPDAEALERHAITDAQTYFEDAIKKINAKNVSYKHVGKVKLRAEEFPKNTSRKITRFAIDKSID